MQSDLEDEVLSAVVLANQFQAANTIRFCSQIHTVATLFWFTNYCYIAFALD